LTLESRLPGTARLERGRPWVVSIKIRNEERTLPRPREIKVLREGEALPKEREGPPLPAPAWADIDRCLAEQACARKGPVPSAAPEDGIEFDVLFFVGKFRSRLDPYDERGQWLADTVAVSLPAAEVGDIRRALEDLATSLPGRYVVIGDIASLLAHLDKAEAATVQLPVHLADSLHWRLQQYLSGENSARALNNLVHYIDLAHPVTGSWPRVRDTLQDALREALSRPGAEGLAARDELLDIARRFADTHRTATAADDMEQRRIQAERPEPEDQDQPPAGPEDPRPRI
jgi:hypothetical protein